MTLNIIYMGSPDFSVPALEAINKDHNIIACYTNPPRKAGRGGHLKKTAVHKTCERLDIPVYTPKNFKNAKAVKEFQSIAKDADFAVVCAYGLILPASILYAPKNGSVNIHASLLPRWRGAAPIQRAIMSGDKKTGITIMKMDKGMDTGDMLLTQETPINPDTTAGELHNELSEIGANLITAYLLNYQNITPKAQPETGVTIAKKINASDEIINFDAPANEIHNKIRGLSPYPGSYFMHNEERIKVFESEVLNPLGNVEALIVNKSLKPGTVLDEKLTILCKDNTLIRLKCLQRPGKKPMEGKEFLRGYSIPAGTVLK